MGRIAIMLSMKRIVVSNHIVADPKICHGKLTFKGTRIMVWQVLEMLEAGKTIKEIIKAFPCLTPRVIRSALSYAVSLTKGGNCVTFNFGV